jgi:hypothetical protein
MRPMNLKAVTWPGIVLLTLLFSAGRPLAADSERCVVCGAAPAGGFYLIKDKVTSEKVQVCTNCAAVYPDCFVCGLPARTNAPGFIRLPDGRALCARDARTAVLSEEDGTRVCRETRDDLERLFSRFLSFPDTNVTVATIDRVHLQDLFKFAGNDYHCPNVWGYTQSRTNQNRLEHQISVLSGLPLIWFQATCAHEYTHAWISQNLTRSRRQTLGRDAEEGFCELVSYLLMDSKNDDTQKGMILSNGYTRGQIDLFLEAERRYGFNDVVDWIQYGTDDKLSRDEPGRIRDIQAPRRVLAPSLRLPAPGAEPPTVPPALVLKAVFWGPSRPSALINDHTFALNEEARVRLGATNITVRCLAIRQNAVRVRLLNSGEERELFLKPKEGRTSGANRPESWPLTSSPSPLTLPSPADTRAP